MRQGSALGSAHQGITETEEEDATMRFAKFLALVMALSLCLPALTWARGESAQPQMSQAEIRQVQERLQELGYYDGAIDGIPGPNTAEAMREYQQARGLPVTGRLDQETAQALQIGEVAETTETTLASGAVGAAAGATLGAIAGSAAVGAAVGGPVGLAAGALGASLWTQLRDAF
jgi:peptidoglycan hydrolase-like protein with peptidoglycan-binding domain